MMGKAADHPVAWLTALAYYYMPGANVSQWTDEEWIYNVAALLDIRKQEAQGKQ